MKWCPSCKKEFADEVNFCKFCGAKLEEKIIEEKKPETEEEKAIFSEEEEKEEACIKPLREKDASFYKKMLLVAGIVIVLLAAVLLFHGGKQDDTESKSAEISAEEKEEEKEEQEEQSEEKPINQDYGTEIGWVRTVGGADFYVPEGFTAQNIGDNWDCDGYYYTYYNEALQMRMEVLEVPFSTLNEEGTPQDIIKKDYYRSLQVYGDFVGYSLEKDNFCVCSANDGDEIYYFKFINVDNETYSTVSFEYPVENRETCDKILTEFLDSLEYR